MSESPQIERSKSPFATLIGRLGIRRTKPVEEIKESRMATEGELVELSKAEKSAREKAELESFKNQLKGMHDTLATRDKSGLLPKKLTDNGDNTYGLFTLHSASPEYMLMYILNTPTDYTAYYSYRKMEGNVNVQFDQKTGEPLKVEVYDTKAMQRDNTQESQHYEYRKIFIFPQTLDDSGKETLAEIKKVLAPYFESYSKPLVPPEAIK